MDTNVQAAPKGLRDRGNWKTGFEANDIGCEYSDEEREFLVAMDRYKRLKRRPYPTLTEVLDVLKSLGWRKQP